MLNTKDLIPNSYSLNDSELDLFRSLSEDNAIIFLSSADTNYKYGLLKKFIILELLKGKTFAFRVQNLNSFQTFLKKNDLLMFAIHLEKDTQIQRDQLDYDRNKGENGEIDGIKSKVAYRIFLDKLQSIQDTYNEPVFGEYPRLKISELFYLSQKRKNAYNLELDLSFKDYLFSQKEFWSIHSKIEKAAKYYKSSFSFLRSNDIFNDDIYKSYHQVENQEIIFKYLQKFISDAQSIAKSYRKVFEQIKQKLVLEYNAHILKLSALQEDFELQLELYKIDAELRAPRSKFNRKSEALDLQKIELRSRLTLLLEEIKKSQLIKINPIANQAVPDLPSLQSFCTDLKNLLQNAHQLVHHKVDEQLEILNANNYNAPKLGALVKQQSDLIYSINGSQIFKDEIHNLSISAWKNYSFLKSLERKLTKAKLFLECNTDYAIYRSFEFSLDGKIRKIIEALENIRNSEWMECFEAWYFEALFKKFNIQELDDLQNRYKKFTKLKETDVQLDQTRLHNFFNNKRNEYGNLQKKVGKEGSDWKSLMITSLDAFKAYFPIIYCDQDFFSSEVANLGYNYLVCVNNQDVPQNIFANSHFQSILCLHDDAPAKQVIENASHAKNYKATKRVLLKSKQLSNGLSIKGELSEKIAISKAVTFILSESKYEKHFYSAKAFSIITCLSPFCAKLLELELLNIRIKSLKYTHLQSGIVDDVILKEEESKYFIIQDGFIDPHLNIEWQIATIENIQNAGFKLISINTQKLAKNPAKPILESLEIPELKSKLVKNIS